MPFEVCFSASWKPQISWKLVGRSSIKLNLDHIQNLDGRIMNVLTDILPDVHPIVFASTRSPLKLMCDLIIHPLRGLASSLALVLLSKRCCSPIISMRNLTIYHRLGYSILAGILLGDYSSLGHNILAGTLPGVHKSTSLWSTTSSLAYRLVPSPFEAQHPRVHTTRCPLTLSPASLRALILLSNPCCSPL